MTCALLTRSSWPLPKWHPRIGPEPCHSSASITGSAKPRSGKASTSSAAPSSIVAHRQDLREPVSPARSRGSPVGSFGACRRVRTASRQRLAGNQASQEGVAPKAPDAVDLDGFVAAVEQPQPGLGIAEGLGRRLVGLQGLARPAGRRRSSRVKSEAAMCGFPLMRNSSRAWPFRTSVFASILRTRGAV